MTTLDANSVLMSVANWWASCRQKVNIDDIKTFNNRLKGELTVVVSEKSIEKNFIDKDKIVNKAKKYLKKYSLKDTVDLILETEKTTKKEIYKLCLQIKNEKNY